MKENIKEEFARNLKANRELLKMTQKDLAVKIGVTQQCISEWENSSTSPTLMPLWHLSDLFGITVDCLIGKKTV